MSEPTDLIREASAALDGITPGEWRWTDELRQRLVTGDDDNLDREIIRCAALLHPQRPDAEFIAAAPDLVRRLRDALATEARCATKLGWCVEEARSERDKARAALAEANTTIERVTHVLDLAEERADDYDAGVSTGIKAALGRIRRALKGGPDLVLGYPGEGPFRSRELNRE